MCQSCVDIDNQIDRYRKQLDSALDSREIERLKELIYELYGERLRKHKNPGWPSSDSGSLV